jgi:ABC-type transporter Mla subunit MlaD
MNNSYTKVNIDQLRNLISSMSDAQRKCSVALNGFSGAMQTLINSGQIEGSALTAFNGNMSKIRSLEADFEAYCSEVTRNLNNVISQEQSIESNFSNQYESLLSISPEDFVG